MTYHQTLMAETADARAAMLSAPLIGDALAGRLDVPTYAAYLTQAFHHVKHTVPLLMQTGARLTDEQEWLREAIAEYIEEETGHHEWVLNDIAACGYDKEKARRSRPNPETELMVAYAWDLVSRVDPVGFFGMVLVLEGTSVGVASQAADAIQQSTGLPDTAFSYLRSHGALDMEHIVFFERLMNRIDQPADQARIAHSARMFYRLFGDTLRAVDPVQAGALEREFA